MRGLHAQPSLHDVLLDTLAVVGLERRRLWRSRVHSGSGGPGSNLSSDLHAGGRTYVDGRAHGHSHRHSHPHGAGDAYRYTHSHAISHPHGAAYQHPDRNTDGKPNSHSHSPADVSAADRDAQAQAAHGHADSR